MVVGDGPSNESSVEDNEPIVAPHLNADAYRKDTTGTLTQSYWEYIRFHSDGTLLIGCSELTGRYWDGGALIGNLPEPGKEINSFTKKAITSNSGTADGFFLGTSNRVILCDDSGAVSIWSLSDDAWKVWLGDVSVVEHDDAIMAADFLVPDKELITVGADGDIKVWDTERMISLRSYKCAHSRSINDVAVRPDSSKTFATVSVDQYVSLWNDDVSKPICEVLKNNCGVRCVKWLDENKILFGDEAGELKLLDVRNPESALSHIEFPAAVHRIAIQPKSKKVAVSCDNKIVTVCDISGDNKINVVYKNKDKHTNYVRGYAWDLSDENILYSVGYDGQLKTHNITNNTV